MEGAEDRPTRGRQSWSLGTIVGAPAALAILGLAFLVVANALFRANRRPIEGTLEYSAFWFMPIIALLGFALAQSRGDHIEAQLIFGRLSEKMQRLHVLLGGLLILIPLALFAWYGLQEALDAYEVGRTTGASRITIWPAVFLAPIGFALYLAQVMIDLRRVISNRPVASAVTDMEKEQSL
ncbi:TRAP transporter small permease [Aeromicrobium sp. YIM 150415]|uniref:TRAP transporter small permease n=1 Tax=Aeromicrobium sp. YIM 150415 TaxID=2803912 RepID=UPI0019658207|nr:TRAP transporter small permease subunit [Aeromicrobium sp. YIM 150415]MBM9463599.1 TRAP transporter small permease [Aeromicrobium sp. YIM 150415]